MTKKSKIIKLVTLVVVLIAVIAAYFVVETRNKEDKENELIENTTKDQNSISVSTIDTDKVVSFSYSYDGVEFEFKKENDIWVCSNDTSKELDQDKLNELVGNFKDVTVSRVVEDAPTDLVQYGLDKPTNIIKVLDTDGNTTTYEIGNKNDVTGGYYFRTQDNDVVYLITSFPEEFSKTLEDLLKTKDSTTDTTTAEGTTTQD